MLKLTLCKHLITVNEALSCDNEKSYFGKGHFWGPEADVCGEAPREPGMPCGTFYGVRRDPYPPRGDGLGP